MVNRKVNLAVYLEELARTWSAMNLEIAPFSIPHAEPCVRADAKVAIAGRSSDMNLDFTEPSWQILGVIQTTARWKLKSKEFRLQLHEFSDDGNSSLFRQFKPYVTQIRASNELHEDIFSASCVLRCS